jgi:hypothetical protein
MTFLLGNTSAHAQQIVKSDHFFDIEYAKRLWHDLETVEEQKRAFTEVCKGEIEPMYDSWYEAFQVNSRKALEDLERHPQVDGIKRCYDLLLTGQVWSDMYRLWRGGRMNYGGAGWNDCWPVPMGLLPVTLQEMNVFTGKCDDMPDWRSDEAKLQDEADIAEGNRYRERIAKVRGKKK